MRKITEEKRTEIINLLKTGAIGIEIAERTEVSLSTVNKVRKEIEREGFDIWHKPGVVASTLGVL